eukprot:4879743-Lingulodinium_polyedra.AAC.1
MNDDVTNCRLLRSEVGKWAAVPRGRILLTTLPCIVGPHPPEREWPWSHAWGPHREQRMPPMVRSRGQWATQGGEAQP